MDDIHITLLIDKETLFCHKSLLTENSTYFRNIFKESEDITTLSLHETTAMGMTILLRKANDPAYDIEPDLLMMVLEAAVAYSFRKIIHFCKDDLVSRLNVENCVDIWTSISQYYRKDLRELFVTAKFMSIENFRTIMDSATLFKLDLYNSTLYLSLIELPVSDEMEIFEKAMSCVRKKGITGKSLPSALRKVIHCVDMNRLFYRDIMDKIMTTPEIRESKYIFEVLNVYLDYRTHRDPTATLDLSKINVLRDANLILNCQSRGQRKGPCLLAEEIVDRHNTEGNKRGERILVYYDENCKTFRKLIDLKDPIIRHLERPTFTSYKHLIFIFGESLASGFANIEYGICDTFKHKWIIHGSLPSVTPTEYEANVSNNCVYFSITAYLFGQPLVFFYSYYCIGINAGTWSGIIDSNFNGGITKCCSFRDKFLVVNTNTESAYTYHEVNNFEPQELTIYRHNKIFENKSIFAIFEYKESLFLKTNKMKKLFLDIDGNLREVLSSKLPFVKCENLYQMKSVTVGDNIYTLYKYKKGGSSFKLPLPKGYRKFSTVKTSKQEDGEDGVMYTYTLEQHMMKETDRQTIKFLFTDWTLDINHFLIERKEYSISPSFNIFVFGYYDYIEGCQFIGEIV